MGTSANSARARYFPALDLIRAAAAMLVMLGHLRNLFFVDFKSLSAPSLPLKALYFGTGLGFEAVVIFFVLSGLLVGGKVITMVSTGGWSWARYLAERASRLCVVLWPALLLTFAFDSLGERLFHLSHLRLDSNVIPQDLAWHSRLSVYLANALFLQIALAPTAGSNGPLWSLSPEFWYYLAFPAALLLFRPRVSAGRRLASVAVLMTAWRIFRLGGMTFGFSIWLMGAAAAFLASRLAPLRRGKAGALIAALLLVAALAGARSGKLPDARLAIGATTALLCFFVLTLPSATLGLAGRVASFFSSFSYTLYLTHLPLLVFLRAWLIRLPRWQPDPRHLALGAALVALATAWAYVVYRMTEHHTPRIRRWLLRLLEKRTTTPPAEEKRSAA